jgi:uncharacterized protein YgiB involved in biofilm formation
MMRKSHYVTILLGGAAAFALWNVASRPEKPEDQKIYGDVQACTNDGTAAEACTQAFQEAKEEHVRTAPKFASAAECEAAGYAKCEEAPKVAGENSSPHFSFMPMMMGYMMGSMMGRTGGAGFGGGFPPQQGPAAAPSNTAPGASGALARAGQPVYADRAGYLRSGNAEVGRVAPGTTSLGSRTVARGGFGGSASGFGGGS